MNKRIDLAGWWQIKFDEKGVGDQLGWASTQPFECQMINIPSCWNEVFPDYFSYEGTAWYFKEVFLRNEDLYERAILCFEGINYRCEIFINGISVGSHEGGFTAFSVPITEVVQLDHSNFIAIKVDCKLDQWTLPPSGVDWFNYGGINRPVYIETTHEVFIDDYTIKTKMDGTVFLSIILNNTGSLSSFNRLYARIIDEKGQVAIEEEIEIVLEEKVGKGIQITLHVQDPHLWKLNAAYLYNLNIILQATNDSVCDCKTKRFGIREFGILGQKVLLNGEEIKLVGCAKHDEYPLTGRAVTRQQLIKDYDLLRQMNANFVRLSHYPHNQLEHEVLEELGMLAISEIPMVFLREAQLTNADSLSKSLKMLEEMIRTEKNNTSIMFWSLFIECETDLPSSRDFVKTIVNRTRELDDTRLIVMASNRPLTDVTYDLFDVVGVNYWEGWYSGATIEEGIAFLTKMAQRYPNKPLLITSHGWEGLYGVRSYVEKTPWSEDSQSKYLSQIADVYMSFKNIVGEIIWIFADFRVSKWPDISQINESLNYLGRPSMINQKGMVDFYRRPKSTYYIMKGKFLEWREKVAPAVSVIGQNLKVKVFSNRTLAGEVEASEFIDKVNDLLTKKKTINIVFASAGSQVEFLESLIRNQMFVDWNRINAFHLDEFVGAGIESSFGFAKWLKDHLIDHLPFRSFYSLNGQAENLKKECIRYSGILQKNGIDIACIGIGENGHLAFNDPPVADFNDIEMVKVVEMDEACREQQFRDGVFKDITSVPRQALTLTIPAIMRADSIFCIVPGIHKSVAIWKTIQNDITENCPASVLRRHPDVTLFLDYESAVLVYPKDKRA